MNHDLVGIKELLKAQSSLVERIKFLTRIDNEKYLREHPEIEALIGIYLIKLMEEKPSNILKFSGEFFNKTDLKQLYYDGNRNGTGV
jgi:hypothetical protein